MNLKIHGQRINDEGKSSTKSPLVEFYRTNQYMAFAYLRPECYKGFIKISKKERIRCDKIKHYREKKKKVELQNFIIHDQAIEILSTG